MENVLVTERDTLLSPVDIMIESRIGNIGALVRETLKELIYIQFFIEVYYLCWLHVVTVFINPQDGIVDGKLWFLF